MTFYSPTLSLLKSRDTKNRRLKFNIWHGGIVSVQADYTSNVCTRWLWAVSVILLFSHYNPHCRWLWVSVECFQLTTVYLRYLQYTAIWTGVDKVGVDGWSCLQPLWLSDFLFFCRALLKWCCCMRRYHAINLVSKIGTTNRNDEKKNLSLNLIICFIKWSIYVTVLCMKCYLNPQISR